MNEYNQNDTAGERDQTPSEGWSAPAADSWNAASAPEPAGTPEPAWSASPVSEPAQATENTWNAAPSSEPVRPEQSWYDKPQDKTASGKKTPRKEKKARKGMSTAGIIALCLVCALLGSVASAGVTTAILRNNGSTDAFSAAETVPVISTVSYDGASNESAAYVYELAKQQVVGISTTISYNTGYFGYTGTAEVSGSGFIISEDGYIITNYHVIEDALKEGAPVTVMMYDETTYEAEIIGGDADNDIALLKIDATGLNAAQLGDSDDIIVGQTVYTIGNPLGVLSYSMTSGIVSALDRTISTDTTDAISVFQIDAAVNSGNSGGPVYNEAGQVIGVVNAKTSDTGVEGLGFAIPISDAVHIVNQLLENGYVADRAHMGISISTVTESAASSYNMVVGAYVNAVNEGSAAEEAGIQIGDIITAVDGEEVTTSSELTALVKTHYAGDSSEITVWRSGEYVTLTIVFEESPEPQEEEETTEQQGSAEPGQQYGFSYSGGDMEDFFRQFFGFGY